MYQVVTGHQLQAYRHCTSVLVTFNLLSLLTSSFTNVLLAIAFILSFAVLMCFTHAVLLSL